MDDQDAIGSWKRGNRNVWGVWSLFCRSTAPSMAIKRRLSVAQTSLQETYPGASTPASPKTPDAVWFAGVAKAGKARAVWHFLGRFKSMTKEMEEAEKQDVETWVRLTLSLAFTGIKIVRSWIPR